MRLIKDILKNSLYFKFSVDENRFPSLKNDIFGYS